MKKLLITLSIIFSLFLWVNISYWVDLNVWIGWTTTAWGQVTNNDRLKNLQDDEFHDVWIGWERWIRNGLLNFARDLKNLFFAIATVYFLIIVIRLLFATNSEDEFNKFKKWLLWMTVWIIVMQIAYSFTLVIFDEWVNWWIAYSILEKVINPLIKLLETAAAFFFIAVAIFAFYRMVTANWAEDKIKTAKTTILYAIIWFVIVKIARFLVDAAYSTVICDWTLWVTCTSSTPVEWIIWIIIRIINWTNSFVWLAIVIMIIYAWTRILLSRWNEESIKKAKATVFYAIIWVFILVINYFILTFWIIPEGTI